MRFPQGGPREFPVSFLKTLSGSKRFAAHMPTDKVIGKETFTAVSPWPVFSCASDLPI